MKIGIIGAGYVGLVAAAGFSEWGHDVVCFDEDTDRIAALRSGDVPIFEPGLPELIARNLKTGRLTFEETLPPAIAKSDVIVIAVGTPPGRNGEPNLRYLKNAITAIAESLASEQESKNAKRLPTNRRGDLQHRFRCPAIVIKSTVPVGTAETVEEIIAARYRAPFDVISNPEFLREGHAVEDFFNPDRIVLGVKTERARRKVLNLYRNLHDRLFFADNRTTEMIKYASNAYLATSISFVNSLAQLCEKLEVDVKAVSAAMRLDKRIGSRAYLDAGAGYGGSCLPKDVKALIGMARRNKLRLPIIEAAHKINEEQKNMILRKIRNLLGEVAGKKIAVWGLAFKPGTDDIRESPALAIIEKLMQQGATVSAFDPVAEKQTLGSRLWASANTADPRVRHVNRLNLPKAEKQTRRHFVIASDGERWRSKRSNLASVEGDRHVVRLRRTPRDDNKSQVADLMESSLPEPRAGSPSADGSAFRRDLEPESVRRLSDVRLPTDAAGGFSLCPDEYEAAKNADLLLIMTEWKQFKSPNLKKLHSLMRQPNLLDARNILEPKKAEQVGFKYLGVG